MKDGRQHLRAKPPRGLGGNTVTVTLDADDYKKLYDMAATRGTSIANMMRTLIREKEY